MRTYTCSECGQHNGHFWNCPETPEPDDDEIQAEAEPEDDEPIYQDQTQNAPLAETRRAGLAEQSAGKRA